MTTSINPPPPPEVFHSSPCTVMARAQLIALTITCLLGTVLFSLLLTAYFAFSTSGPLSCILIFSMVVSVVLLGIALISICRKNVGAERLVEENRKLQGALRKESMMLKETQAALVDKEACIHELAEMLERNQKKLQEVEEKHEKDRQQSGEFRRLYQDSRVLASELEAQCALISQTGLNLAEQLQDLQIQQAVTLMERGVAEKECGALKNKLDFLQEKLETLVCQKSLLEEKIQEPEDLHEGASTPEGETVEVAQGEQGEVAESQEGNNDLG